jgi:hypothetical protein
MLPVLYAQLHQRQDVSNLVAEIIGASTLDLFSTGATSHLWIHRLARQVLLRLQLVYDIQQAHQTRLELELELDRAGHEWFLASRKCDFETAIYVLHVGINLEAPDAPGIGKPDYGLCRGLVLGTFLSVFRALILHKETLTFEQEDLLRRKVEDLCKCWASHEPLLPIEDLIFRQFVPATLDDIQDHDGESNLHFIACRRFNRRGYQSDRVSDQITDQLCGPNN